MKPALLIIDIQRWFFETAYFATDAGQRRLRALVDGTNALSAFFHERGFPIFRITTAHDPDGGTRDLWGKRNGSTVLTAVTPGVCELDGIASYAGDIAIVKTRHSAFIRTDLEDMLRRV